MQQQRVASGSVQLFVVYMRAEYLDKGFRGLGFDSHLHFC